MNNQVTELDLRMPQFRNAKLEDLEFDSTGEVVRKDRFEKSMRKISGMLHGVNGLSARSGWTCEQVVVAVDEIKSLFDRLKHLLSILRQWPEHAEFYHFENECYVRHIDQEHLGIAKAEPNGSHLINFEFCEVGGEWDSSSGWLEYINALVSVEDIQNEVKRLERGES